MQSLLLATLKCPSRFFSLRPEAWDLTIREARRALLLGQLGHILSVYPEYQYLPERIRDHFTAAMRLAEAHERMLRWESEQIAYVLAHAGIEPVVLKGAAYLVEGLSFARGRIATDVDILVAESQLAETEACLKQAGWIEVKSDDYDQTYYREWMHELPPLMHRLRGTVVDIHHNIVPRTARLKPKGEVLIAASRPSVILGLRILAPEDTVLNKVVHLFLLGEFDNSLRELVDLDGLLKAYGSDAEFWARLLPRAQALQLSRPLYYGLRYARQLMETPIPDEIIRASARFGPAAPVRWLMDRLIHRALRPVHPDTGSIGQVWATKLLYLRSHWLKMPPLLLLRHLVTKAWKRRRTTAQGDSTDTEVA